MQKKEKPQEISIRTPEDESSTGYQIMDAADDDQILSDFQSIPSEMLEKWVYKFVQNGKELIGLSWVGTKEITVWLAGKQRKGIKRIVISELPEVHELKEVTIQGKNYVDATVGFEDLVSHRKMLATVRQPYTGKRKDGSDYPIDVSFVPRIAISKAQRNAIQKLIPSQSLALFIDYALKNGKVQTLIQPKSQVEMDEQEMNAAVPHLNNIEKLTTIEECRAYYSQVSRLVGQPQFTGKVIAKLKEALNIKATKLKNDAAKAKVKELTK